MKRKLLSKLLEWKEETHKKPILLTGGRGVGKTYFVYDFAKTFYTEYIYINFESDPHFYELILNNPSIETVLRDYFHLSEVSSPILVILDEITRCPDSNIMIYKFLKTEYMNHIIAITSNISQQIFTDSGFYQLELFPMDFEEFLIATGNEWYIEVISVHFASDTKIPDIVHQELLTLFELYYQIGGMPMAVNEYINTGSAFNVPEQHRIIVNSYLSDSYRFNTEGEFLKISQTFNTIDKQLIKNNRKFQYKLIRKGATQAFYADALQYIKDTGYGIGCYKLGDDSLMGLNTKDTINPFDEAIQFHKKNLHLNFKLYMLDVGILYSALKKQYIEISDQYLAGILENYVAQCLTAQGYPLYFWESDSQAKIDFIIKKDNKIIPIEVRSNDQTRSRNVSIFRSKFTSVSDSIKISTRNFEYCNHVKYVPIYAVFCI
ncbi:ATP-binding protein [Anaerocolumna sp. MB42-C2]|uniref:ATP-binding protein n=1 Tax=Anaerocolumna sp. MB42-C2 TaxID=3070997 RepID=UPI0027DEDC2C|nr:DUF4143 domain-containing protein [Anaerocolumna sp. MB42-C2]WMJ88239.1 DUF4143 domain-containing protein [Anaerocolumna sp. MB42-C2]